MENQKTKFKEMIQKNYYKIKRLRLKNKTPTIIASDCFGVMVYHNLGLPFLSPTVNLGFDFFDFHLFVSHLRDFMEAEPYEVHDGKHNFPVGELSCKWGKVRILFGHYKTFEEAVEKWNQRKQRISYDNIYIIQTLAKASEEALNAFDALPYKNKILITDKNLTNSPNVATNKVFLHKDYQHGDILKFEKGIRFYRRYMDSFDYVSFLNRKN